MDPFARLVFTEPIAPDAVVDALLYAHDEIAYLIRLFHEQPDMRQELREFAIAAPPDLARAVARVRDCTMIGEAVDAA